MQQRGKTLLFIDPCESSACLILKAKEKGYRILIIASHSDPWRLPEAMMHASSSFFQLDPHNDGAVLDLIDKIVQKFPIDGVIPGTKHYAPLTGKVAAYLNKPGLTPESAQNIQRKDLIRDTLSARGIPLPNYRKVGTLEDLKEALEHIGFPCILQPVECTRSVPLKKVHTFEEALKAFEEITSLQTSVLVEEYIHGVEYSFEGFSKEKSVHIVSMTEKLLSAEENVGHIVHSEINPDLLVIVKRCLTEIISAFGLTYGFFQVHIRLSEKGPVLMNIGMGLAEDGIPQLIGYATGIDYYNNVLKLLSGQPLSLHKTQNMNAGLTFFYHPALNATRTNQYFDRLLTNPHVRETKAYVQEENEISNIPLEKYKVGHAVLLHEDYETLKQYMMEMRSHASFS